MTKDKELQEIRRYIWEEVDGYDLTWEPDCDKLAEKLYEDGWHRDVEANWGISKIGDGGTTRTCSHCHISQTVNVYNGNVMFNYCPYCGARMDGKRCFGYE